MARRMWVFAVIALGLPLTNMRGADPNPASLKMHEQLARAKVEAARKTFEVFWRNKDYPDVEIAYRWSCRWLEAQQQLSAKHQHWIAACQAHWERMRELEQFTRRLFDRNLTTIDQVRAAVYYVAEAEVRLVQAKEYGSDGPAVRR